MSKKTQESIKLHIKKDDIVMVIAGADKGKKGKVLFIDKKKNRAIVEGVNLVHKHLKPNATYPNGAIEKREAGVHLSNLMHIDPKTGVVTRIGRKEEDGKLVRYAKKSGEVIDK
jgi:large subunit ribosomal protein L24